MAELNLNESLPTIEAIYQRSDKGIFSQRPVSRDFILALLQAAQRAPSSFNLQPWQFVIVDDADMKSLMSLAALGNNSLRTAPVIIAIVSDPDAWRNHDEIINGETLLGCISSEEAIILRDKMRTFYQRGFFGLSGAFKKVRYLWKNLAEASKKPICSFEDASHYAAMQSMLPAAYFQLAASSLGLHSEIIDDFDEGRLKKLLKVPNRMSIPVVLPLGYPIEGSGRPAVFRKMVNEVTSFNLYGSKG